MQTNIIAIMLLLSVCATVLFAKFSWSYKDKLEETEVILASESARADAYYDQTQALASAYKQQAEEIDNVLRVAENRRRAAERRARTAQAELDAIAESAAFDSPLPRPVIDGLSNAACEMSDLPTSSGMSDDPIDADGASTVPAVTCRDISEYALSVAEALTECNGKLKAMKNLKGGDS